MPRGLTATVQEGSIPGSGSGMDLRLVAVLAALISCFTQAGGAQTAPAEATALANDPRVVIIGRFDARDAEHPRFAYPGGGLIFRFQGSSARIRLTCDSGMSALTAVVDHGAPALLPLRNGSNDIALAANLTDGPHTVEVYKRTEAWQGLVTIQDIRLSAGGALLAPPPQPARKLMFLGDSVTCGAGIDLPADCKETPDRPSSDAYNAYGMILGRRLDAQAQLVCYGGRGLERDYRGFGQADNVLNAPEFLHLSIPVDDPKARVPWDASRWQPDAIVVSLGTNDFNLQKSKPLDEKRWVGEYVAFLKDLRQDYPHALILLTEGAIVTDPLLRQMIQQAADAAGDARIKWIQATHYPGRPCNAHPTGAEHLRIADDLEPVLRQALGW